MPDADLFADDAPASEGAGGTGLGDHELLALSETGVKAPEEDVHPHGVGSVPSTASEDTVGDLAVTGTGLAESDPVQTPSGAATHRPRGGLQRGAKRKKRERETIRVPAVKQTDCPRWMHHRPGVYCKACGKTP